MFGFLFLNSVSKLKRRKVLKPTPHLCFTYNKTSGMSLVVFLLLSLVYMLSINNGVALSFAKKLPVLSVTNESFLLTTGSEIVLYTPSNSSKRTILSGLSEAKFLEVAPINDKDYFILWSDARENSIQSVLIENSDVVKNSVTVVVNGVSSVSGIFVDRFGENLYWLDKNYGRVEVSKYDGSMRTSVIYKLINASCLAGDPHTGFLFWSSVGPKRKVVLERSRLDGSGRSIIFEGLNLEETIEGISVNEAMEKIFWIDKNSCYMHKCNYDGSSLEIVGQSQKLSSVISVIVANDNLFWVQDDRSSGVLVQVNGLNLDERKILTLNRPFLHYAKILPSLFSKTRSMFFDACKREQNRCTHLCLRGSAGASSCFCPYSLELSADNKSCHAHGPILGFSSKEKDLQRVHLVKWKDPEEWVLPPIEIPVENAVGFTSDPEKEEIYWIDNKKILKQSLTGQTELVLNLSYFNPQALALDWKSENLYVLSETNEYHSVLSVCKSSGHSFSHLIWHDMYKPKELSIDTDNRKIFWSHWKENFQGENFSLIIETSNLNGQNRKIFLNSNEPLQSFVADSHGKQLCWLNQIQNLIICHSYYGNHLQTLKPSGNSPLTFMCSFNGYLVVANEMGILQTVNVSSDHQNALYINTSLSICFVTVLTKSQSLDSKHKPENFLQKENNERVLTSRNKLEQPFLLYLANSEPHTLSLIDTHHPELLPYSLFDNLTVPSSTIGAIDQVAFTNFRGLEYLYWIDSDTRIKSIGMDGKTKRTVFESDFKIGGIAFDSTLGNIYWTLPYEQKIMAASHDGQYPVVLVNLIWSQPEKCYPSAISFDSFTGNLFFILCCEKNCEIHKTTPNGSSHSIVKALTFIGDLVVEGNYLYWTQPDFGAVHRINLYTKHEEIIVQSTSAQKLQPISLAIGDGVIYWTDRYINNGSVIEKRLDEEDFVVVKNASQVWKLLRIPNHNLNGSNPCLVNKGGCSHLCIYQIDSKDRCYCSYSHLVNDSKCEKFNSYLLLADSQQILSLDYQSPFRSNPPLETIKPNSSLKSITTLAYNELNNRIYFSDLYQKPYIYSILPNGTGLRAELKDSDRVRHVEGMVFDSITSTLFWTESFKPSIWSLHKGFENEIFSFGKRDKPRGIAIHSCTGQIFWTNSTKIETGSIDGEKQRTLIDKDLNFVSGLSIYNNELFWTNRKDADVLRYFIEKSNLDGSNRELLISGQHRRPFMLTITENAIFWTDREDLVLCKSILDSTDSESCTVVMKNLKNPLGILIVEDQKLVCEGSLTKSERCFGSVCRETISYDSKNSTNKGNVSEVVQSQSSLTFRKLIISGSVIITGAIITIIVLLIRRKNHRKRIPKCVGVKSEIAQKSIKEKECDDCMLPTARSNPSFELDDVFCSDILEEDGTLINS